MKYLKAVIALLVPVLLWPTVHQVNMQNNLFVPDSIDIFQGDTVNWTNLDAALHTSTSGVNGIPDGFWNSGTMQQFYNCPIPFNFAPGAYPYYCAYHWASGMTGKIVVHPVGISETQSNAGRSTATIQIHPNPFHQYVTIRYSTKVTFYSPVTIHNCLGQVVKVLVSNSVGVGAYSVVWDGTDQAGSRLPPGIYFVCLENNDYRTMQTTVLMK